MSSPAGRRTAHLQFTDILRASSGEGGSGPGEQLGHAALLILPVGKHGLAVGLELQVEAHVILTTRQGVLHLAGHDIRGHGRAAPGAAAVDDQAVVACEVGEVL